MTTYARHMCAKLRISHGYIVVFPWILIKPGGPRAVPGVEEKQEKQEKQQQQQQHRQQQQQQRRQRQARAEAVTATATAATAGATAVLADVCERYRYLREGICVELAYNRRADLLMRNPAVPRLHVSRELYSLREHNI